MSGLFGGLFDTSSNTQSQNTNNSTTQNNLFNNPFAQGYLGNYFNQYSAGNIQGANTPVNGFQYGAANNQLGATANLQPGFNVSTDIAYGGLSPTAYQPYMSQFTQSVINPTISNFANLNQQSEQNIRSRQGAQGSLGNSTNPNAYGMYLNQTLPGQEAQIAGLTNQGYNQAVQTALASQNQQLQASGQLGSLTGAQTGANTGLNNIGSSIWNEGYLNSQLPFSLYNQGLQGISQFGNLAGSTTNSNGTTNSTTTQSQSPFQQIAGLAGLGLSAFSGIPGFSGMGGNLGAMTGMIPYGSFASGGSVMPAYHQEEADPADRMHQNFQKAFDMVNRIRGRASGGGVDNVPSLGSFTRPGYEGGGAPEFNPWSAQYGAPTYANDPDAALSFNGITPYDLISDSARSPVPSYGGAPVIPQGGPTDVPIRGASAIAASPDQTPTPQNLAAQGGMGLGQMPQQQPQQPDPSQQQGAPQQGGQQQGAPDQSAAQNAALGTALQSGMMKIPEPVAPLSFGQQWASALLSGNPQTAPIGQNLYANRQEDLRKQYAARVQAYELARKAMEWQAKNEIEKAGITGTFEGKPTMEGQKLPLELQGLQARTIEGQKEIETNKNQIAKDLAAQQQYAKSVEHINMAEGAGVWTPEEANAMRQRAYELYQRTRGQIQDVGKPPQAPVNRAWVPGQGVAPRPTQ